jgi:hypothetical protein
VYAVDVVFGYTPTFVDDAVSPNDTIHLTNMEERMEESIKETVPERVRKREVRPESKTLKELCTAHKIRLKLTLEGVDIEGGLRYLYRAKLKRPELYVTLLHATNVEIDRVTVEDVMCAFLDQYASSKLPYKAWCEKHSRAQESREAYRAWQAAKLVGPRVERICGGRMSDFQTAARTYLRGVAERKTA